MENFSSLVRSVECKLHRELHDEEVEFLDWLYQQHREEKELKA